MAKWSYKEDLAAYQLSRLGMKVRGIANVLGRSESSVLARMGRKGLFLHPPVPADKCLDNLSPKRIFGKEVSS